MQNSPFINQKCETIRHEDNFQLMKMLFPVHLYQGVCYETTLGNRPVVQITVSHSFKYTTEIELKYIFKFGHSEKIIMRCYEDAKVAEIVYCTDFQQFIRLLGPRISPKVHLKTRSALNVFLNKLLNFLLKSGYNHNHWIQLSSK
jgi:uncharacterized protein YqiB (DUF1249 family)